MNSNTYMHIMMAVMVAYMGLMFWAVVQVGKVNVYRVELVKQNHFLWCQRQGIPNDKCIQTPGPWTEFM